MSDIVEQLRKRAELHGAGPDAIVHLKAGDEIERLRAEALHWAEHESEEWKRMRALNAELLAALKATLDAFDQRSHGGRVGWEQDVFDEARAAIQKAKKS